MLISWLYHSTSSVGSKAPPLVAAVPPPLAVSSHQDTTSLPSAGLTVQSGTVTNVSSLLVKTESITAVPTLNPPAAYDPSQTLPALPHMIEISPVALDPSVPTSLPLPPSLTLTSAPLPPLSSAPPSLTESITGTGSVTATPSAYTTAVTTTATTTTSTTPGQSVGQMAGKRIRRQSSKYEDYEQQTVAAVRERRREGDGVFSEFSPLQKLSPTAPTLDTLAKPEKTMTNQLQFLLKATRALWRHHYAWPFHKPVDPVALKLPVSPSVCLLMMS